jgi:hypothetical protein
MRRLPCFCFLAASVTFQARMMEGITEGPTVEAAGAQLVLNGTGTYRRYLFSIYRVYLYLEHRSSDAAEILASPGPKFARMTFLRDLDADDLKDAWLANFEAQCASECESLRPYLNQITEKLPTIRRGDSIEFTFLPDRLLMTKAGSEPETVESGAFAAFQLRSWLGDKPPSESFRSGLLGSP